MTALMVVAPYLKDYYGHWLILQGHIGVQVAEDIVLKQFIQPLVVG